VSTTAWPVPSGFIDQMSNWLPTRLVVNAIFELFGAQAA
jgi:hypothetical protein